MASVPIFRYSSCCITTDAQTVRPYRSRIALLETDALRWTRSCIPIFRYSSRCTTTDAQTERPYRSRIALLETDALSLDTRHFATRLAVLQRTHRPCVPTGVVLLCWRRTPFAGHDCASLYFATRLAVLRRTLRPSVPTGVVLLCWRRTPFAGHDRASLQESYCFARDGRLSLDTIVCPYRVTFCFDTMDALLQNSIGEIGEDLKCWR